MFSRSKYRSCLLTLLFSGLVCASAAKADLIDQQNTFSSGFLGPSSSPAQSFIPTLSGIDFATFSLSVGIGGTPAGVFVDLFNGAGSGGTFLAATSTQLVGSSNTFQTYRFDFPSTVTLVPGQVCTLVLNDSLDNLFEQEGSGNPYPAGVEYDSAGGAQLNYDLVFSEGLASNVTPVPEPSTIAVVAVACLAVLGVSAPRKGLRTAALKTLKRVRR